MEYVGGRKTVSIRPLERIYGIMYEEISATELKQKMDAGEDVQLVDVRNPDEYAFAKIPGAKLIPLGEVVSRMKELDPDRELILQCKMGGRSAKATQLLRQNGLERAQNLKGGILAWIDQVDPSQSKY